MHLFHIPFLLGVLFLVGGCAPSVPTLHVFIWTDYIRKEVIDEFEKLHGCRVVVDTYDSNEAMYAKLKLGGAGYDIVVPSSYFIDLMIDQGMLQPLDLSKIPNSRHLDPRYAKFLPKKMLDRSFPYMLSATGIAYRSDKLSEFEPSWGAFGKHDYKGRMTMLDDLRETLGVALLYLGYSANTTNKDQVREAGSVLREWKQNLAKFEGQQYKAGIANGEYLVVHGYNGDLLQVIQEDPEVAFVYPVEGSLMTVDMIAIPTGASQVDLAHAFIDYLWRPEVSVENMKAIFFLSPNTAAYELLPKELRENRALFATEEVLDKLELIRYLGADSFIYEQEWDRVKAE